MYSLLYSLNNHKPLTGHAIDTRPSADNVESLVSLDNEGYCPRDQSDCYKLRLVL